MLLLSNVFNNPNNLASFRQEPVGLVEAQSTCPGGTKALCGQLCAEELWTCKIAQETLGIVNIVEHCDKVTCSTYCNLVCNS